MTRHETREWQEGSGKQKNPSPLPSSYSFSLSLLGKVFFAWSCAVGTVTLMEVVTTKSRSKRQAQVEFERKEKNSVKLCCCYQYYHSGCVRCNNKYRPQYHHYCISLHHQYHPHLRKIRSPVEVGGVSVEKRLVKVAGVCASSTAHRPSGRNKNGQVLPKGGGPIRR